MDLEEVPRALFEEALRRVDGLPEGISVPNHRPLFLFALNTNTRVRDATIFLNTSSGD